MKQLEASVGEMLQDIEIGKDLWVFFGGKRP
jgi:hypothetical protein